MKPKPERQKLSERYAHGFHSDWVDPPSTTQAHEAGQDDGFDRTLSLLNGQEAEAQMERWKRIGLIPTSKDWAAWLYERK